MIKSIIVARGKNGVIGRNNQLIWRLPKDLKFFKQKTMGHHIIMGRKTFESMGKPLPGRTSVIITRNPDYKVEGAIVAHSLEEALNVCQKANQKEVFIIGGADIYKQALSLADIIYVTEVEASFDGDAFFPEMDLTDWKLEWKEKHDVDEKHLYPFLFTMWKRK
ncbi:dihydrofolate reductase [Xanthovirga aplysinae]|uniref:dihydrofolate reductase n=1 Tax=Xanthovirga aplysinae TaxID=2529853 RepID=UPI0012BD0E1F|nr:dihydrofolate reductase [Xanthovirga aplysinae]MTI31058.1 dihydrofolate reductase [Xanthovirga aplysinae]